MSILSRQSAREQSSALIYPSVGYVQIYFLAVNIRKRCMGRAQAAKFEYTVWSARENTRFEISTRYGRSQCPLVGSQFMTHLTVNDEYTEFRYLPLMHWKVKRHAPLEEALIAFERILTMVFSQFRLLGRCR